MSTLTNAAAPAAPLSAVNPLLTPTWNRHGLNGTPVELEDLVIANETSITASSLEGFEPLTAADFDAAWNAAEDQARSMTARRVTVASTADVDETPFREFAAKAKDPLDVPARNAVPRSATDAALSDDAVAWLQENTLACASLEVPAYRTVSEPLVLRLAAQDGALSVATVNLLAGEGSTCTIIIEADSPTAGSGAVGVNLKVVAQENARVTIRQQQTLDSSWAYFESTEIKQAASSRVDVNQMYLGSAQTFAGLGSALLGARASVSINTTYLGTGDRVLDLNYLIRQFGKNTESKLIANGVLAGTSSKALRGTIDLVHGAKGAHGHELETVLLANPKVRNRSLPIILCDEDDVQGDHGATIGHVPADQRYYLGSRGLDEKTAEGLFLRSTFEKGLVNAFDQASRNAVMRLAVAELGADFAADEEEDPMTETSEDRAGTAFDPAAADIEQNPFKADFPLLANNPDLAFLDSAATAQRPACVIQAQKEFYETMNSNPLRGLYRISVEATQAIDRARKDIADFIGADDADEVVFTRNASESLNLLAKSFAPTVLKPGDEVVISIMEHHSNLIPWQQACKDAGATLVYLRPNDQGEITDQEIAEKIGPKTRIVSVAHVSNVLGVCNPVRKLADAAHAQSAYFFVDGAQSVPHMKVDVKEIGCDAFAFSGHKVFGPMGVGVLWGTRALLEAMPPLYTGGEMIDSVTETGAVWAPIPTKFEAGTQDAAGIAGLGAAVRYVTELGHDVLEAREAALTRYCAEQLAALPFVRVIGPQDPSKRYGVVAFTVNGIHPHDVSSILDSVNVAIRAGHHCAQPLLDWLKVEMGSTCRASLAFYNDKADVDKLIEGLKLVWKIFGGGK